MKYFFEAFSEDESTYGRLSCDFEMFEDISKFSYGTTNIDYSENLYNEFQKMRNYKETRFEIDPDGFEVRTTAEDVFNEVKIELPDSWMRGFLQVSTAMSLPAVTFHIHPMDMHAICLILRRHKEKIGPRSLRFKLRPGMPVEITFDPWNYTITCPRSQYQGKEEREIRVWGRRRLHVLERLISVTRSFTVHLMGNGMPSFYVADMGTMSFTLGLSGWTANDWSHMGNFDLLAPREDIDVTTKQKVFDALKTTWKSDIDSLVTMTGLTRNQVVSALTAYTQAGRVMYDLHKGVYRVRELTKEELPLYALRFTSDQERDANALLVSNAVTIQIESIPGGKMLNALVKDNHEYTTTVLLDEDEGIADARCTCNFFQQNKLHKGPCPHILAAKMKYMQERKESIISQIPHNHATIH
ncbi:MAG: SWIM zinc finger family protein [Candidatus Dojkabacteria bacterium]